MATREEIRVVQTSVYYDVLEVERINQEAGIAVKGLKNLKNKVKSTMHAEDIAWVEKQHTEANEN